MAGCLNEGSAMMPWKGCVASCWRNGAGTLIRPLRSSLLTNVSRNRAIVRPFQPPLSTHSRPALGHYAFPVPPAANNLPNYVAIAGLWAALQSHRPAARHRGDLRSFVGYHGIAWASMGTRSKSLGFPGFTPLWQVKVSDIWNKT